MFYLFGCRACGRTRTINIPMALIGTFKASCACGSSMGRVYTPPTIINYRSSGELAERALRGEETVPGLTREESMATAAQMAKDRK